MIQPSYKIRGSSKANNIKVLSNETFNTLKCVVPENVFDSDVEIEMEFEIK